MGVPASPVIKRVEDMNIIYHGLSSYSLSHTPFSPAPQDSEAFFFSTITIRSVGKIKVFLYDYSYFFFSKQQLFLIDPMFYQLSWRECLLCCTHTHTHTSSHTQVAWPGPTNQCHYSRTCYICHKITYTPLLVTCKLRGQQIHYPKNFFLLFRLLS